MIAFALLRSALLRFFLDLLELGDRESCETSDRFSEEESARLLGNGTIAPAFSGDDRLSDR